MYKLPGYWGRASEVKCCASRHQCCLCMAVLQWDSALRSFHCCDLAIALRCCLHDSLCPRCQVDQKKLTYVNPTAKAEANAARAAFGTDYEATLRREAGPQPDKLARRKHQISSLYHQAKMKVGLLRLAQLLWWHNPSRSWLHGQVAAGCSSSVASGRAFTRACIPIGRSGGM